MTPSPASRVGLVTAIVGTGCALAAWTCLGGPYDPGATQDGDRSSLDEPTSVARRSPPPDHTRSHDSGWRAAGPWFGIIRNAPRFRDVGLLECSVGEVPDFDVGLIVMDEATDSAVIHAGRLLAVVPAEDAGAPEAHGYVRLSGYGRVDVTWDPPTRAEIATCKTVISTPAVPVSGLVRGCGAAGVTSRVHGCGQCMADVGSDGTFACLAEAEPCELRVSSFYDGLRADGPDVQVDPAGGGPVWLVCPEVERLGSPSPEQLDRLSELNDDVQAVPSDTGTFELQEAQRRLAEDYERAVEARAGRGRPTNSDGGAR